MPKLSQHPLHFFIFFDIFFFLFVSCGTHKDFKFRAEPVPTPPCWCLAAFWLTTSMANRRNRSAGSLRPVVLWSWSSRSSSPAMDTTWKSRNKRRSQILILRPSAAANDQVGSWNFFCLNKFSNFVLRLLRNNFYKKWKLVICTGTGTLSNH